MITTNNMLFTATSSLTLVQKSFMNMIATIMALMYNWNVSVVLRYVYQCLHVYDLPRRCSIVSFMYVYMSLHFTHVLKAFYSENGLSVLHVPFLTIRWHFFHSWTLTLTSVRFANGCLPYQDGLQHFAFCTYIAAANNWLDWTSKFAQSIWTRYTADCWADSRRHFCLHIHILMSTLQQQSHQPFNSAI